MSEQRGALCYLIQETKDSPVYMCVMDYETEKFHRFNMSVAGCSRLVHDCSGVINAAISGFSDKHAFQVVAAELSKRFKPI